MNSLRCQMHGMELTPARDMKPIRNYATLDEVDLKSGSRSIVVRLLRMWEAQNFKRAKELMSIDFLLLDEKDCVIQGSIHRQRIERFKDSLTEGEVFLIQNFDVVRSGNKYRLTDHKFMIRFTDQTRVVHVGETNYSIQLEKFRFRSYDQYVQLADKNEDLPDVIGLLSSIQKPEDLSEKNPNRVGLRLLLEEGVKVRITIWDDLACDFCEKLEQIKDKNIVTVVTSINPKKFAGELYLNTTTSTKFYLNADFDIVGDFRARVCAEPYHADFISSISKNQYHNISEILKFVSNEEEQDKDFTCKAKVMDVLLQHGWSYIACSKCSKKLEKSESTLICSHCGDLQAVGVLRFRIEVVVDDGTDTATFVIFDRDAKKITRTTASEIMEAKGDKIEQEETAPPCILDIVGRTFTFHIKVISYNFRYNFQSFTVSSILANNCGTENKELNQKDAFATEDQSVGSVSSAKEDSKCEITDCDSDTEQLNIETNKRRKM